MAMKDHNKKMLTPKLRFPEFKDAGEWEKMQFTELYTFKPTNAIPREKLNYNIGRIRNIHYGDIHTSFQVLFDIKHENVPFVTDALEGDFKDSAFCTEGDLVFAESLTQKPTSGRAA